MKKELKKNVAGALTYDVLNIADYTTTKYILKTGGHEVNPIVRFLIKKKCFGLFKIFATLAGMTMIYHEEKPQTTGKIINSVYGAVVANNVSQILKYKKSHRKQ